MIRVALADDHPIVREALAGILRRQPDMRLVGMASSGAEVAAMLDQSRCDVVVLDLTMPDLEGLELVRHVRERHPNVAAVVFTMTRPDILGQSLLAAGVLGYVRKDRPPADLMRAIRNVAAGRPDLPPGLERGPKLPEGPPHERLSPREAQVFAGLCSGQTVKEIAETLEISASTASNHASRIREKLGLRTTAEILLYATHHRLMD